MAKKPYKHIRNTPQSETEWCDALISLARYLRSPEGCPWDRKQTSQNFAEFLREEAQELLEAFNVDNPNNGIEEEWGDCLFTLLAVAAAAETEGRFDVRHALERIHDKIIRRHGHIFGDYTANTPEEVVEVWRKIKAEEKKGTRD